MATTTIDPKLYSLVFAGHIVVGVADGTFISVEQGAAVATKWVSAWGEVIYVFSADRSASITVRLKPDSPSSIFLHRAADLNKVGPLEWIDANGTGVLTLLRANAATVGSRPSTGTGAEVNVEEWVILVDKAQQKV